MGAEVEMIKGARAVDRAPNASRFRMRDTVEPRSQSIIDNRDTGAGRDVWVGPRSVARSRRVLEFCLTQEAGMRSRS